MNANNKKFGLGRGLEALLGEDDLALSLNDKKDIDSFVENTVFKDEKPFELAVNKIEPCPFQPRKDFNQDALQALSESIKEKGVLQPLLVRKKGETYEIIAGERRWRAAKMAGLKNVPAIVRNLSDKETLEIALIENLQRENLSAIEEAEGLNRLIQEYQYTQDALSKVISKSRSYIANSVRLLNLPPKVQEMVRKNQLSAGHARALVGCAEAEKIAQKIVAQGLNVRQTEQLLADIKNKPVKKSTRPVDFDLKQIMSDLEKKLKLKVKINASQNGKGSVTLKYNNPAELSAILDILEQR